VNDDKNTLGYILGHFVTNKFGHPAADLPATLDALRRDKKFSSRGCYGSINY
jgi:hypothetical protein